MIYLPPVLFLSFYLPHTSLAPFKHNTTAYLRNNLTASPSASQVVSKTTLELLQSNFRMAKAGYYDANFTPLMQAISDVVPVGGQGGECFLFCLS